MLKKILDSPFTMRRTGDTEWLPAAVPGSVYGDLLANGMMEDPFFRANEAPALKLMEHDYEYQTFFSLPEEFQNCEQLLLEFQGLDTLADLSLNEIPIGHTDNMHRTWEIPVRSLLKPDGNRLYIIFHSPLKFFQQEYDRNPLPGAGDCIRGFASLRKAHCMSGWDWGPRLPDAGIWRNIRLIGFNDARLENVYLSQEHIRNTENEVSEVLLHFRVDFRKAGGKYPLRFFEDSGTDGYAFHAELLDPEGNVAARADNPQILSIPFPRLWWPNGFGDQPLYTVAVSLTHNGTELDRIQLKTGLRTMTIIQKEDAFGKSFAPSVNGIPFFAMGADYIPEDNLLGRISPESTRRLLTDCKTANFNFIRVWGGGYYPDDWFYDICDELGLCVWQDFMFACAVYNLTPEFEKNVRAEFTDNIRRLRHHPSLALWCGNNEMEESAKWWEIPPKNKSDYIKLFEYIIPSVLKAEDPQRFYWPSSPSSGGGFDNSNDERRGDVHYWDVWHGNKPFTEFRKFRFRFLSEFGFQSFPCPATVQQFTFPGDRNIFSFVMEKHQRNGAANGKIMNYLEQTYLYPNDFNTLLYASQLLQADAIRCGVEHFRRIRGICMGTVYWQLNDCWPAASWSSIDYYGRWKALHYAARRFFAPVLLSCAEEGMLTQDPNVNAQPYNIEKSIRLCLSNETTKTQEVLIRWALRDTSGNEILGGEKKISAEALSSVWLDKTELPKADLFENYVSYEAEQNGKIISSGTVLFCAPKFFHFKNPELTWRENNGRLQITACAYAKSVEISDDSGNLLLSDNYFDMSAGTAEVQILRGTPENLRLRSVYDIR